MPSKSARKYGYRKVLEAATSVPWAITLDKLEVIREILELRLSGEQWSPDELRDRIGDVSPMAGDTDEAQNIAVLDLFGVIMQRASLFSAMSGAMSTETFAVRFKAAVADENVTAIIINTDSPGGSVTGVPELADLIYKARGTKPIIAISNSQMASAAYWIASAADEIVVTPSSYTGSIGVYTMHHDISVAESQAGHKTTIISAGQFKTEGSQFEALGETARAALQDRVSAVYSKFVAAVARNRGVSEQEVRDGFGQGRVLLAEAAVEAQLADRVATFDDVLSELGAARGDDGNRVSTSRSRVAVGNSFMEHFAMNKELIAAMVTLGLCTFESAENEARAALKGFFVARGKEQPDSDEKALAALKDHIANPGTQGYLQASGATDPPAVPAVSATIESTEDRTAEIMAAVQIAGLSDPFTVARELIDATDDKGSPISLTAVLDRIAEKKAAESPTAGAGGDIHAIESSRDKLRVAARDALLLRTGYQPGAELCLDDEDPQTPQAWNPDRRNMQLSSLPNLGVECAVSEGADRAQVENLRHRSPMEFALFVMGLKQGHEVGIQAASTPAYNQSGMYTNILRDAQNVNLRRSYREANTTFQAWTKQAESPVDFKEVNEIIAGEIPDPKAIPENGEFEDSKLTDGREPYKLTTWGRIFSITWQSIVNDRLSAFMEVPAKQGRAMRRKQNKLVYSILKDNDALVNDGLLLFEVAGSHVNYLTSGGAPSVATLNVGYKKMAEQTGLDSDSSALGIEPQYILAPPNLRGTILELLGSTANPAASGNSGIVNIWQNGLTPVIDAELGTSFGGVDAGWYLAANPNDVDTIVYAYLRGLETPALDSERMFDRLAIRYRIYQAFATKAIDYRGLFYNDGA